MSALHEACQRYKLARQNRLAFYNANTSAVLSESEHYKSLMEKENVWCEAINRIVHPVSNKRDYYYDTRETELIALIACSTLKIIGEI